jgi:hypothetical protein
MLILLAGAAIGVTLASPDAAQALGAGPACQNSSNPDDIIRRGSGGTCPDGYNRVRLVPAGSAAAGGAAAAGAVGGFGAAAAAGLVVAVVGIAVGGASSGSH